MLVRFLAGRSREEDATALAMSIMYSGEEPGCVPGEGGAGEGDGDGDERREERE